MRLYHYLNQRYAIQALRDRRLKVARLRDLNDPFEYYHLDMDNTVTRDVIRGRRKRANWDIGLLCFSKNFSNPVQWAHYGDSHRGLCIGFDIPDELLIKVEYIEDRGSVGDYLNALDLDKEQFLRHMLSRKYLHWSYEQEHRKLISFPERRVDYELIFEPFSDEMIVKEVLIGCRCDASKKDVRRVLDRTNNIAIHKVFPSHTRYEMERDDGQQV